MLFIDEIPALPQPACEVLYESLQSDSAPRFTLIGATTDEGLLHGAFLSRFENQLHLGLIDVTPGGRVAQCAALCQ